MCPSALDFSRNPSRPAQSTPLGHGSSEHGSLRSLSGCGGLSVERVCCGERRMDGLSRLAER